GARGRFLHVQIRRLQVAHRHGAGERPRGDLAERVLAAERLLILSDHLVERFGRRRRRRLTATATTSLRRTTRSATRLRRCTRPPGGPPRPRPAPRRRRPRGRTWCCLPCRRSAARPARTTRSPRTSEPPRTSRPAAPAASRACGRRLLRCHLDGEPRHARR